MPLTLTQHPCGLLVEGVTDFSLPQILDCGQCFTFSPIPASDCIDGILETWKGFASNHPLTISQLENGTLLFHNTTSEVFSSFWEHYFDLDTDYTHIKQLLSQDSILHDAIHYAPGIRILRQDGWEALCCFIISQNLSLIHISEPTRP